MESSIHTVRVSGEVDPDKAHPVRYTTTKTPFHVSIALNYNRAPDAIWLNMSGIDKGIGGFLTTDEAEEVALAILIRVREIRDGIK